MSARQISYGFIHLFLFSIFIYFDTLREYMKSAILKTLKKHPRLLLKDKPRQVRQEKTQLLSNYIYKDIHTIYIHIHMCVCLLR